MHKLEALWLYQQADAELDRFESSLRNTETYKRFIKVRAYLDDQKKVLQRMSETVEQRKKAIEVASEHCELFNTRYLEGIAKFEAADQENVAEVERYRKHFENLANLITQERKTFFETVSTLEKEDEALNQMRIKIGRARKEYEELKAKCDQERVDALAKISELKASIAKEEALVDPLLMERYKTVKRSQPIPVAKVTNNKCNGCNMELPAVLSRKLREGSEIAECDNCGRILYLEK